MNEKCKYCDYVSKCSRKCEYNSILCKVQRSFSKVVDKSYEQLQQENEQLKLINKEYERLNKENGRGFKITNVQEYNVDELLSYKKYKDNWNKLREWIIYNKHNENTEQHYLVVDYGTLLGKMQELEGNDSNE